MTIPVVASTYVLGTVSRSITVKGVSPAGAFIVTNDPWYPGTVVTMSFEYDPAYLQVAHIQGREGEAISVRARVLRQGPAGAAVRFVYRDASERLQFQRFLEGALVRGTK
jgi:hypothetical protein